MSEPATYTAVLTGDLADWRLVCVISGSGMSAYLKNEDPLKEIVTLFDEKWSANVDNLLSKIEETVYDHPQVLDDITADIVVIAPNTIVVPTDMVYEDDDEAYRLYSTVYAAEERDLMTETIGGETILYNLVTGLNAFLQRTFPGANVHNHMGVLLRRFRDRVADVPRVYIDIREKEADFVVLDRKKLLLAATHRWDAITDIQYHLFNILDIYGLKADELQVSLSGLREVKSELAKELRKKIAYVMMTMVPSISTNGDLPIEAAFLMRN